MNIKSRCEEFNWPVRVYYEDTDNGGVVYHANYLKFMERCRTEWLRNLGYEQDQLIDHEQLIFAVRSVAVDYLKPARFNDALTVTTAIESVGRLSIDFRQTILRGDELLCVGRIALVSIDSVTLRPKRLSADIAARLEELKTE